MSLTTAATLTMHPIPSLNEPSRYLVGIDLGTTNSGVVYFETEKSGQRPKNFLIPQKGRHGHEEMLPLLPSFLLLEDEGVTIGLWAKIQGAKLPTRLIHSAKSWLSNAAARRKEKILPLEAIDQERRLSPVEASYHYLDHIRKTWNRQMAKGDPNSELESQEIVLTVPASFDEVARALTVEAALQAGLTRLTLLEEPQAAFYNWLLEHGHGNFQAGDSILICDVGGGTTDFTWIDVVEGEQGTEMRRMHVGRHLLLGGDNMDATLCHAIEGKLNRTLDTPQHLALLGQVRNAKEELLSGRPGDEFPLFVGGSGGQVVGGSLALSLKKEEVEELLLEGFFGLYPFEEALSLQKGSGIRQMGLPFESDPSITKHLASFLAKSGKQKPTYLLFNGGAIQPSAFQERIIRSLNLWFLGTDVKVLKNNFFDLAVARGAAFYALQRHTQQIAIRGGIPRSYYLELDWEGEKKALTLCPRGAEEGTKVLSEKTFFLTPNQPVSFQLYSSDTRLNDAPGMIIPIVEEELNPLPPLFTLCKYGKKGESGALEVQLELALTPLGTLEIWLIAKKSDHRWKLEFNLRGERQKGRRQEETFTQGELESAQRDLIEAFAIGGIAKLQKIMAHLEEVLGKERKQWPLSLLRGLFDTLLTQAEKRQLSSFYESRFWNLAGFFLRPGMGYPVDEHRIKEIWKIYLADLKKSQSEEVALQQWICYRRIAAGLNRGQQGQLFSELSQSKQKLKGYLYAEHLRVLSALELVEMSAKWKLGNTLLKKITTGKGEPCDYWALGRLGARHLFHGTAANVLPRKQCEEWVLALLNAPAAQNSHLPFTLAMLARKTGNRTLDLSPHLLEKVAPYLIGTADLLYHERELTLEEQEHFFGDSLPPGLSLTDYTCP